MNNGDEDYLKVGASHTSCQIILDSLGLGCGNMNIDADGAHANKVATTVDLDDAATLHCESYSAITTSTSFSSEIPKSDNGIALDGESRLHSSLQENSITSPSRKRSRSIGGSYQTDGSGKDWIFDVFAEHDSETEGDGSQFSKRLGAASHLLKAAENRTPVAVAVKDVQMSDNAHGDRQSLARRRISDAPDRRRVGIGV